MAEERLEVRLDPERGRKLRKIAETRGATLSYLVREMIDEVILCRSFSLHTLTETRQPAAWALAEATARTSEIPLIRASHVDPMRALRQD